jgi:IS5 family transposase
MNQLELVSLDSLVSKNHQYRKFKALWDFKAIEKKLSKLSSSSTYAGYGIMRLFLCLLVQFMENLSDRELEAYLEENTAGKWFCDFQLQDKTPDHTLFTKIRKKIGTNLL